MGEIRICGNEECGAEFVVTQHNKRYCCDSCKKIVEKKRSVLYSRNGYQRQKERMLLQLNQKAEKRKAQDKLKEIAIEARNAGMSYGQYVAKYGL